MAKLHKQVPVKVTAFVDEGIAEVVKALNDIDGISTFSSCEGRVGKEYAHVYFDSGEYSLNRWQRLARLSAKLAKILSANEIYDATVSLEWAGDKEAPFIAIKFEPQQSLQIAKILVDHKTELTHGT
jgi:hypothetical protein